MTDGEVMAFVRRHGVVLMAAKGPVPRLTEWIAGEPIKGSWWAHSKSHQIFARLSRLSVSPNVVTCRLVDGHVTFVHRRLWPALVRLSDWLPAQRIAAIREQHTASGKHVTHATPFPDWVPPAILRAGRKLEAKDARAALHMISELSVRVDDAPQSQTRPRRAHQPRASSRRRR